MAFMTDNREDMLDQHESTTRILSEVKTMADAMLLPEIQIPLRLPEIQKVFDEMGMDSRAVMGFIVFLLRIKRGGPSGSPAQDVYDDICKKIGVSIDEHPQEFLTLLGTFGKVMNEKDRRVAQGMPVGEKEVFRDVLNVRPRRPVPPPAPALKCDQCGRAMQEARPHQQCKAELADGKRCKGRFRP